MNQPTYLKLNIDSFGGVSSIKRCLQTFGLVMSWSIFACLLSNTVGCVVTNQHICEAVVNPRVCPNCLARSIGECQCFSPTSDAGYHETHWHQMAGATFESPAIEHLSDLSLSLEVTAATPRKLPSRKPVVANEEAGMNEALNATRDVTKDASRNGALNEVVNKALVDAFTDQKPSRPSPEIMSTIVQLPTPIIRPVSVDEDDAAIDYFRP